MSGKPTFYSENITKQLLSRVFAKMKNGDVVGLRTKLPTKKQLSLDNTLMIVQNKLPKETVSVIFQSYNPYLTKDDFLKPLKTYAFNQEGLKTNNNHDNQHILDIFKIRNPRYFHFTNQYVVLFKNIEYCKKYFKDISIAPSIDGSFLKKNASNINNNKNNNRTVPQIDDLSGFLTTYNKYVETLSAAYESPDVFYEKIRQLGSKEKQRQVTIKTSLVSSGNGNSTLNSGITNNDNAVTLPDFKALKEIESKCCLMKSKLPSKLINVPNLPTIFWQYDLKHAFPIKDVSLKNIRLKNGGDSEHSPFLNDEENIFFIAFNNPEDVTRFQSNCHGMKFGKHKLLVENLNF
ncbi:uncharacterized protein SCODWIG_00098 [Saccharomycodes ludwigii]|uniref:Uncharacterized protein n=1 Tax=Saccharomycodes ludwigii TaxID=36035 RepID=A0A376B0Z1_9ASCO|nr:hypothetical protein SCDLUD_004507 [Saccharomycodes ludwigii]KAH3899083.1 hypothetical protein SCDLUD_004507 [Saccharomycodes ludwigii]SSD58337.1 uncharacterized protein SCODWIG_00098 [Saccharomycodes ludwigii]